jgi:hypothetical protein
MIHSKKIIAAISLCALLVSCGGGSPTPANNTPPANPVVSLDPNATLNVRQLAKSADYYAIYYGALDPASILALKQYPLVIVHPHNGNITRPQIRDLQRGVNTNISSDNVVVLCYISIGEDSRTYGLSNAQMLADTRFTGNGTGPSVDPRGKIVGAKSLVGLNPLGVPTNGGFASWYLNDNATYNALAASGVPDENPNFLTRYVNAGDPAWYNLVNNELADAPVPVGYPGNPLGMKEMLSTTYGRGLGCDGVFLDTIDTAAPNSYAPTISNFEWTANGYTNFIKQVRLDYPGKVILQNRGLFFFDPRMPHNEVSARGAIDLLMFESYRLNSNSTQTFDPYFFPDNKYNFAPKLMAEANRVDGFKVISLGYADGWAGPKPGVDKNTLLGTSLLGWVELQIDFLEALSVGFRHYLTDASITLINPFVKNNANLTDTAPPQWSSIYNVNNPNWPAPASAPSPRIGVQVATSAAGSLTLSWDVALDVNSVGYALYYQTTPFNFATDPNLMAATRVVLTPTPGTGYAQAWSTPNPNTALLNVYPHQQTLSGLPAGATYYLVIRAFDSRGNEEKNQVVLSALL